MYEHDILKRYKVDPKTFIETDHTVNDVITLKFADGKRICFTPRIKWSEVGAFPVIKIQFQDNQEAIR